MIVNDESKYSKYIKDIKQLVEDISKKMPNDLNIPEISDIRDSIFANISFIEASMKIGRVLSSETLEKIIAETDKLCEKLQTKVNQAVNCSCMCTGVRQM